MKRLQTPRQAANAAINKVMEEIESVRETKKLKLMDNKMAIACGAGPIDFEHRHRLRKAMALELVIGVLCEQYVKLDAYRPIHKILGDIIADPRT